MIDSIKEIIAEAIYAPSGDNSQPWRFEIEMEKLFIYNRPEEDNPILNFKQTGSYIAHGALLENILIVSKNYGLQALITCEDEESNEDLIATITFEKCETKINPLYQYIKQRHTNRKPYKKEVILNDIKKEILNSNNLGQTAKILLIDDIDKRKIIAQCASLMETIALETKDLHHIFFGDILWEDRENMSGKKGLYIKTLELPTPIQFLFKTLRNWKFTRILNKIGFSKIAAKGNAKIYASGGAMGVITIPKFVSRDYIEVGRLMQRAWLIATKNNLNIQPITGITFLANKIMSGDDSRIIPKNIVKIKKAYGDLKKACGIESGTAAFIFRIGYADPVSAYSRRKEPEIKILQ